MDIKDRKAEKEIIEQGTSMIAAQNGKTDKQEPISENILRKNVVNYPDDVDENDEENGGSGKT